FALSTTSCTYSKTSYPLIILLLFLSAPLPSNTPFFLFNDPSPTEIYTLSLHDALPNLRNAHRLYSYAICGSQHLRDVYSEAFGIERESVFATGLPRIDGFLRDGRAEEVLAEFETEFPTTKNKRKILWAPTFRGRGSGDAHYDYDIIDFRR